MCTLATSLCTLATDAIKIDSAMSMNSKPGLVSGLNQCRMEETEFISMSLFLDLIILQIYQFQIPQWLALQGLSRKLERRAGRL